MSETIRIAVVWLHLTTGFIGIGEEHNGVMSFRAVQGVDGPRTMQAHYEQRGCVSAGRENRFNDYYFLYDCPAPARRNR